MKEVNAYYRKHGKLDGCALLSPDQIEKLKASMASSWRSDPRPFESYQLTNNNAEIRRVKARIEVSNSFPNRRSGSVPAGSLTGAVWK